MSQYGVTPIGKRFKSRPYVQGHGHVYAGTFDTEEEATKAALAVLEEERRLLRRETVASFSERWVRDFPRPKESTNDAYASAAGRFAAHLGERLMHRVTPRDARAYVADHPADRFALSAMFGDARREGISLTNPFSQLRTPRGRGRKDIAPITVEELETITDLALQVHGEDFGTVVRAAILVAAHTGIRPGELCGLEWRDVDPVNEELAVRRQIVKGCETTPKSGRTRTVFLPPTAAEALDALPVRHVTCPVTGGRVVFPGRADHRLQARELSECWQPIRRAFEAGLSVARHREFQAVKGALDFYALRHFCATRLVEQGIESWIVARQLGHEDGGRLVDETYAHPRDEVARAKLREAFEGHETERATSPVAAPSRPQPRPSLVALPGGAR
ncbi:MAG: tyrosine-type recombinase/integrase [Solirubrobacterales bacterium]